MKDQLQQEFTEGQKLVGLDFNPSGNQDVHEVKLQCAKMLDLLIHRRNKNNNSYGMNLILGAAMQAVMTAQMWVVKAITYRD